MKNKFAEENSIRTREIHFNPFLPSIMLCKRHFSSSQIHQPHHRRKESSRVYFTRVWNPVRLKLEDLGCVNVLVHETPRHMFKHTVEDSPSPRGVNKRLPDDGGETDFLICNFLLSNTQARWTNNYLMWKFMAGRLLMIRVTLNPFSKQSFVPVKMQVHHMPKKILYGRLSLL